jgi:uncharacterized protein YaaQ
MVTRPSVHRLMIAIVQAQDADNTIDSICDTGLTVTRIGSYGGFLGRGNVTLMIGLSKEQETTVLEMLSRCCRRRIEYIATPLEGSPFHLPLPTPVTVGGATVFTFDVDRYEEIP